MSESAAQDRGSPRPMGFTAEPAGVGRTGEPSASAGSGSHGTSAAQDRVSVHKLLAEAKDAAGDRAVKEHERGHFAKSREWAALAAEIDRLLRQSVGVIAGV